MAFPAGEYGIVNPLSRAPSVTDVLSTVGGKLSEALGPAAGTARALIERGYRDYTPEDILAMQGIAPTDQSVLDVLRSRHPSIERGVSALQQGYPFYPTRPIAQALGPRGEEEYFRTFEPEPTGAPGALPSPEQIVLEGLRRGAPGLGATPQLGDPPEIVAPDYSRIRDALGQMTPGSLPRPPTGWEQAQAGLAHASLASAQGTSVGSTIALAAGAGLLGAMEQRNAYERRMDAYSKRASDIAQKKAEVETSLSTLDANRELNQARIGADFQLKQAEIDTEYAKTRATLALNYAIHDANIAMERIKLSAPYVAVHENRLIVQQRDMNGRPTGAPIMYTVNEIADGIAATLANASLAKALGGGGKNDPSQIALQVGNLKKTFRGPVGEALSYGMLLYQQNAASPEIVKRKDEMRKQILEANPFLVDTAADELEQMVETQIQMQLGLGVLTGASQGQTPPELGTE